MCLNLSSAIRSECSCLPLPFIPGSCRQGLHAGVLVRVAERLLQLLLPLPAWVPGIPLIVYINRIARLKLRASS
jgi:hypothetical protein